MTNRNLIQTFLRGIGIDEVAASRLTTLIMCLDYAQRETALAILSGNFDLNIRAVEDIDFSMKDERGRTNHIVTKVSCVEPRPLNNEVKFRLDYEYQYVEKDADGNEKITTKKDYNNYTRSYEQWNSGLIVI